MGEGEGGFDRGPKRIFVDAIRGSPRGAAIDYRSNGNIQAALGDVLVNGIVGKARERFGDVVDLNLCFVGAGGLREPEHGIGDSPQFAFGKQLRGGGSALRRRGFARFANGAH